MNLASSFLRKRTRPQCNGSWKGRALIRRKSLSTYTDVFVRIARQFMNLKIDQTVYNWFCNNESGTWMQSSAELVFFGKLSSESSELVMETRGRFLFVTTRIGSVDGEEDASSSLSLGMIEGAQCWGSSNNFAEDVAEASLIGVSARFRRVRGCALGLLDNVDADVFEEVTASLRSDNRCSSRDTSQCWSSPFSYVKDT